MVGCKKDLEKKSFFFVWDFLSERKMAQSPANLNRTGGREGGRRRPLFTLVSFLPSVFLREKSGGGGRNRRTEMNIFLRLSLFLPGSERTRKKKKERIMRSSKNASHKLFLHYFPTFHIGALSFHTKYSFRNQCAIAPVAWMAANPVSIFRKKT